MLQVRQVVCLDCDQDGEWALQLLGRVGPQLRVLEMTDASREALLALGGMSRLIRLSLFSSAMQPLEFPAHHAAPGLEWLHVENLPEETTFSLIAAHRRSLRHLTLLVGLPRQDDDQPGWPEVCDDLPQRLGRCLGPPVEGSAIVTLSLQRLGLCRRAVCALQRCLAREAIGGGVDVGCHTCDTEAAEEDEDD